MFRSTLVACAKKPSSKAWVSRQKNDFFVKQRIASTYKARSAYKLIEIDDALEFLRHEDVQVVVDLGAAPGGWSQVVSERMGYGDTIEIEPEDTLNVTRDTFKPRPKKKRVMPILPGHAYDPLNISTVEEELAAREAMGRGTIIAVDLLPMGPIPGVRSIQGDFLSPETDVKIHNIIHDQTVRRGPREARVDVVLSDMAPNVSGHDARDLELSEQLCLATLNFAKRNLRASNEAGRNLGGVLVMKYFASNSMIAFRKEHLDPYFTNVRHFKPASSRSESSESYLVCRGWQPNPSFRPSFGFL